MDIKIYMDYLELNGLLTYRDVTFYSHYLYELCFHFFILVEVKFEEFCIQKSQLVEWNLNNLKIDKKQLNILLLIKFIYSQLFTLILIFLNSAWVVI